MVRDYQKDLKLCLEALERLENENFTLQSQLQQAQRDNEQVEEQLIMALGEDMVEQAGTNAKGAEALRLRLQQAGEREAALIEAFDEWSEKPGWVNDEFDKFCGIIDSLRTLSPSQPSRYQNGGGENARD